MRRGHPGSWTRAYHNPQTNVFDPTGSITLAICPNPRVRTLTNTHTTNTRTHTPTHTRTRTRTKRTRVRAVRYSVQNRESDSPGALSAHSGHSLSRHTLGTLWTHSGHTLGTLSAHNMNAHSQHTLFQRIFFDYAGSARCRNVHRVVDVDAARRAGHLAAP